jgi:uroporphyrinogen-III synthase
MAFAEPPGWYVISLRPQGEHGALRRAAAVHGARVLALSPWRLRWHDDDATRESLRTALAASRVVFTSPVAVRAAAALQELRSQPGQHWVAVGSGTARALHRAGVVSVQSPARMDSEGLLGLPALQTLDGTTVGLVTAPQGRDVLATELRARGAELLRADVYTRVPVMLSSRALHRLRALDAAASLTLSSGAALQQLLANAPADVVSRLQAMPVVAASQRLVQVAHDAGFADATAAEGPMPRQILAAMARRFR